MQANYISHKFVTSSTQNGKVGRCLKNLSNKSVFRVVPILAMTATSSYDLYRQNNRSVGVQNDAEASHCIDDILLDT